MTAVDLGMPSEIPVTIDFAVQSNATSDTAKAVKALARGKKSLKELAVSRSDTFYINPYDLYAKDNYNCREMTSPDNLAHIDWLARNIARRGVKKALEVSLEDGKFWVEDGFCRHFAVRRAMEVYGAEIRAIPVTKVEKGADEADRVLKQIVSNSGKQLTALEQGAVIKRLLDFKWTIEQVAEEISRSVTHVNNLLELQSAHPQIKQMIIEKKVAPTLAREIIRDSGSSQEAIATITAAFETAEKAGRKKVTARTTGKVSPIKRLKEVRDAIDTANRSKVVEDGIVKVEFDEGTWEIILKNVDLAAIQAEIEQRQAA